MWRHGGPFNMRHDNVSLWNKRNCQVTMLTGAQWQPLYYCVRCSGVSPSSAIEHFIFCLFTCFCWQWTGQKQWFCMSIFFASTLQRLVAFGNSHVLSISIEPKNKNKMHQPIGTAIAILSASTSSLQNRRSPHYVRRTLGLHFPLDSVFFFSFPSTARFDHP